MTGALAGLTSMWIGYLNVGVSKPTMASAFFLLKGFTVVDAQAI